MEKEIVTKITADLSRRKLNLEVFIRKHGYKLSYVTLAALKTEYRKLAQIIIGLQCALININHRSYSHE